MLALLLLMSCSSTPGTNGRAFVDPPSGEGPCFQVDLMNGLNDAEEASLVFDCFNEHGAFRELAPMVDYLTSSQSADDFLEASNGMLGTFELSEGMQTASNLMGDERAPLASLLDIYTEVVDQELVPMAIPLVLSAANELVACEDSTVPEQCSVFRLGREVLHSNLPGRVELLMEVVAENSPESTVAEQIGLVNDVLVDHGDDLLDLALYLYVDGGDGPPIGRLLDMANAVDDLGGLFQEMAQNLSGVWNDGTLAAFPAQLDHLLTHNAAGDYVGPTGVNVLDELTDAAQRLAPVEEDGSATNVLFRQVTIEGRSQLPISFLMDSVGAIYESPDVTPEQFLEDFDELVDAVRVVLGSQSETYRALVEISACLDVINDTDVLAIMMPVAYSVQQQVDVVALANRVFGRNPTNDDITELTAFVLDLTDRTRFFTQIAVDHQLMQDNINLFPVFVDTDRRRLSASGEQAIELATFVMQPYTVDGVEVTPALLPADLVVRLCSPGPVREGLRDLLLTVGELLVSDDSKLSLYKLETLAQVLEEDVTITTDIDPIAMATDALDNEALWLSALRLASDEDLMQIINPAQTQLGPVWYLYDLIDRGVLGRVLSFASGLLEMLDDDA